MLRLILIEHDSFMMKNGKVHLLVPKGERFVWWQRFNATFSPEINYLHGDSALPHIKWSLSAKAAKMGWVLTHSESSPEGVSIYCGMMQETEGVFFEEGEAFLVGELLSPTEVVTVSPQNADKFRQIRNR